MKKQNLCKKGFTSIASKNVHKENTKNQILKSIPALFKAIERYGKPIIPVFWLLVDVSLSV